MLGFPALATTSSGHAATLGRRDQLSAAGLAEAAPTVVSGTWRD